MGKELLTFDEFKNFFNKSKTAKCNLLKFAVELFHYGYDYSAKV